MKKIGTASTSSQPTPDRAPRSYEPPKLVEYGSIAKLTRGGGSLGGDGGSGMGSGVPMGMMF
jgi:hypothetical protein